MAKELVLLTGASGFIGQSLAERLARGGYRVRALFRRSEPPARLQALEGKGVELFRGDLCEPLTIGAIVEGCSIVVHAAALASDWGSLEQFRYHNVQATRLLAEAARAAGARKFVHISSAAVHGYGGRKKAHVGTTEEGPYFELRYPYQISKKEAEDLALSRNGDGFEVVAIRPANVYGPGDATSTYRMFDQVSSGVFGWLSGGRALTCPVYIDDLCDAVFSACGKVGLGGRAILVSDGERVTWKDYASRMFELAGGGKKPMNLPGPIGSLAASIMEGLWKFVRAEKAPPLVRYVIDQGRWDYHFSPALAKELLGFAPKVFYREGLSRTYEAWKKERASAPGDAAGR